MLKDMVGEKFVVDYGSDGKLKWFEFIVEGDYHSKESI